MKMVSLIGLCVFWGSQVLGQRPIEYSVSLPSPQTQTVEIECRLFDLVGEALELKLPVWRPGKYEVLDPAGTLYNFQASDGEGKTLSVKKTDKSTWEIDLDGSNEVVASYTIYANSLSDRTRHVDDTHAFLSGSAVFVYTPSRRSRALKVRFQVPESWEIASGLESSPGDSQEFLAESYDALVDSPFEIGLQTRHHFVAAGRPHEIVVWGEASYDEAKLVNDFKRIVENQITIWGDVPYERYVFLLHLGPGFRGGTEHINSTIMQASREQLEDPKKYKAFLGLVSHEFFHTWNIKQIRPSGLSPYEYQAENYTPLLWLVEGTTSYYDDLTLFRSGLLDQKEYLERLSKLVDGYRKTPGRFVQSLAESSFDAWIKFTHPTPHSPNTTISFYSKGALVSLLLDLHIRELSKGQTSMDELLRRLYQGFPLGDTGYTEGDLQQLVTELTGNNAASFFDSFISGVTPLDLERALRNMGLKLALKDEDEEEGEEGGESESEGYLGLNLKGNKVTTVLSDGPAYQAGVMAGDEILSIDNRRLSAGTLTDRLEELEPGQEIELALFRRDQLRVISLELDSRPRGKWTVFPDEGASSENKRAFERWTHRAWSAD
jgi:predicted metalloprotease with PDZ domain